LTKQNRTGGTELYQKSRRKKYGEETEKQDSRTNEIQQPLHDQFPSLLIYRPAGCVWIRIELHSCCEGLVYAENVVVISHGDAMLRAQTGNHAGLGVEGAQRKIDSNLVNDIPPQVIRQTESVRYQWVS